MNVMYFTRGDYLAECVRDADFVFNAISSLPENNGFLGREFYFDMMKTGARFLSVTSPKIYTVPALIEALGESKIRQAALDIGGGTVGDVNFITYKEVLGHPKIIATPQVAHYSDHTAKIGYDMMIDNIEARIKGEALHILV